MTTYPFKRYALVSLRSDSEEVVSRHLPANYSVTGTAELTDAVAAAYSPRLMAGRYAVIEGRDDAGWTLDDYVIPRLASGLIAAQEIGLDHPVMKGL